MVNYQNGKVYMIESLEGGCRYYGATTASLSKRLGSHRSANKCRPHKNTTSKLVLNYPDARILLVENYPCNSKTELEAREAHYIRNNECVNKNIPQRTAKEHKEDNRLRSAKYYKEHKEENSLISAKYYKEHKEVVKLRASEYYKEHKEVVKLRASEYRKTHVEDRKEYDRLRYQNNKKNLKLKSIEYYNKNKDKVLQRHQRKCICECGKPYTHCNYPRHLRTKQHIFYQTTFDFIYS
jgi:hypothetical protein